MELRWCPGCAEETAFVAPPCEDGHGEDCLDLACDVCGLAVTGVLLVEQVVVVRQAA